MLHQHTLQQLKALRLDGMARAFEEQLTLPIAAELAFEDRFAQLVDRELHWRDNQRRDGFWDDLSPLLMEAILQGTNTAADWLSHLEAALSAAQAADEPDAADNYTAVAVRVRATVR